MSKAFHYATVFDDQIAQDFGEILGLASASISIDNLTADNIITAAEMAAVTVSGTTVGIADAETLSINLSDGVHSTDLTATVSGNAWTSDSDADLSAFDPGNITVTVELDSDTTINQTKVTLLSIYKSSIYAGTKDVDGEENIATGVTALQISGVVGSGTISPTVNGVALFPVFNTATDTERFWLVSSATTVRWLMSGTVSQFDLGQGKGA